MNANPSAILAILAISFPVRGLDDLAAGTGNCPVTSSDGSCHETWRGKLTDAVHLCADLDSLAPTHSNLQPGCCYVARSTDAAYTAAQRRPDGTVPHVPWPYSMITTSGGPLPWSIVYIPGVDQAAAATADAIVSNDWSSRRYISLPHVGACLHARRDLLHPPLVHRRAWAGHGQKMH